ncbi:MAG TPA: glutamine-hydrolyzing GMP synthase [Actinomycetota bacterium]|nr:glutamine-hydrolyzing GMP synthase [Actinomycetota bacterium]
MEIQRDFDTVLVVDFGAQYSKLIARRVRECHVHSEIVPQDITADEVIRRRPKGLILSGGPSSVNEPGAPGIDPHLFDIGVPILGICYGHQLMAAKLGGLVSRGRGSEFGPAALGASGGLLFADLPLEQTVWMSHHDAVTEVPEGFNTVASTDFSPVAAMEDPERGLFGVQFHPEVVHSPHGTQIIKNFVHKACDCLPGWTASGVIEAVVDAIREQVGDAPAICGLSGGVDSSVAAALVHKAIGDQLTCIFVDHGMLRAGEAEQVVDTFRRHLAIDLIHVKAEDRFLAKLQGVVDPEAKRRVIGNEFIRVFEEVAAEVATSRDAGVPAGLPPGGPVHGGPAPPVGFLVQGTLYPDVIESGGKGSLAAVIKTHHNVGGLPSDMKFQLVEPLRELFKDEVRLIGEELGLPEEIVWRQPFPGPGLAVRIVGEVTSERLELVRAADAIVVEEIKRAGLHRQLWQAFAVLLSVRSVGVMGDQRSYGHPVVVRAVTSEDAMTADWARLDHDLLARIATRIVGEIPGINRVAYDISSKPPATIEWE